MAHEPPHVHVPARRLRGEGGFTAVELLITTLLLTLVLSATLAVLDQVSGQAARDEQRSSAVAALNAGFFRMANDLRHATTIVGGNAWAVEVQVRCRKTDATCLPPTADGVDPDLREKRILYRCDAKFTGPSNLSTANTLYRSCVRTVSTTLNVDGVCCTSPEPGTPTSGALQPASGSPANSTCGESGVGSSPCAVVIERVKNWDTTAFPGEAIFTYIPKTTNGGLPETTEIQIQLRVPRAGERSTGIRGDVLFKDSAYLRNNDLS